MCILLCISDIAQKESIVLVVQCYKFYNDTTMTQTVQCMIYHFFFISSVRSSCSQFWWFYNNAPARFDGSTNYSTHGPGGPLMDRLLILGSLYKMLSTYLHLHHNDHFDDDQNPQCLSSIDVTHIAIAIGSDCDSDQNGTPFGNVVLFWMQIRDCKEIIMILWNILLFKIWSSSSTSV